MKAAEFDSRVRKFAKRNGRKYRFEAWHGKGSHGRLYLDSKFTTLKDRRKEIGEGLLHKMLADLGLKKEDLDL
jgi:mRNA interferase HicA